MNSQENTAIARGNWASGPGFILAASGSAIGLGNIWRFPYMTGENGGALFVLIYVCCVLFLAFPIMVAEVSIGRCSGKNPVGAFLAIAPGKPWFLVGGLGVITGLGILSYYSVIAGWTLGYFFKTVAGAFQQLNNPGETEVIFSSYVSSPLWPLVGLVIFLAFTEAVVIFGIQKGIERICKIFLPLMFIILIVLAIRAVTLPGSGGGIAFYLKPDFREVSAQTVVNALGQSFFSLSLGMGAMITYGSYLSRRANIFSLSAWICAADTSVAFLAGLAIFPALFALGLQPAQGPGLIFIVVPNIFGKIPLGQLFGALFFLLLVMAALTSTISLLEVVTSYLVDERKMSRAKASLLTTLVSLVIGVPVALSTGAVPFLTSLYKHKGEDQGVLSLMDLAFGSFSLVIGALFIALFAGWAWKRGDLFEEISQGSRGGLKILLWIWYAAVKVLCPLGILAILINLIMSHIR